MHTGNLEKDLTILMHKFLTSKQATGQRFNDFVTELRQRAADCKLGDLTDSFIKDVPIIGMNDLHLRERFLREHNIKLEKAIQAGLAAEQTRNQAKAQANTDTNEADIAVIRHRNRRKDSTSDRNSPKRDRLLQINSCKFCSSSHPRGQCPSCYKWYIKCQLKGHF